MNPPTKTPVTYSGLADVIKNVNPDNLTAFVDANHTHAGAAVRLNVLAQTTLGPGVNVQTPAPIVVTIDTRTVIELPVQVSARAAAGWALIPSKTLATCPGAANPNPCKVHFDAPLSWESNLTARATLPGLVSVGSEDSPNQPVVLNTGSGLLDLSVRTVPTPNLAVTSVNIPVQPAPGASISTVDMVDSDPPQC